MNIAEETETANTTQYLSFLLDNEIFAMEIKKVREVLDYTTVTQIPQMPDFMRGVINLRGSVVPVIDLRLKFNLTRTEQTIDTCIIITEVMIAGQSIIIGNLADSVQEVFDLPMDMIEPSPKIGSQINTEFLKGMGKKGEDFVLILDINRIFSEEDAKAMDVKHINMDK